MPGKIFCRERVKVGEGKMQPQYRVVAVAGADISFSGPHFRKRELEEIANVVGAELVVLSKAMGHGQYKAEKE
jgi:hypothetical protein